MATTTQRKRKSDASSSVPTKKTRTSQTDASDLVASILDGENFKLPDDDATITSHFTRLARYARSLETALEDMKPKEKTQDEIDAAAEKLRAAVASGIKKQMTWKPSCKTGGAKWSYDGVCADPAVFAAMLNLEMPIKFKMKKMTPDEFQSAIGDLEGHARYNTLYIRGTNVTVHWKADEGTFKMSGTYGA